MSHEPFTRLTRWLRGGEGSGGSGVGGKAGAPGAHPVQGVEVEGRWQSEMMKGWGIGRERKREEPGEGVGNREGEEKGK